MVRKTSLFILRCILGSALLAAPAAARAELGDCCQPVSTGPLPSASDCLYTLRSSVGLVACDNCVCDVDASGTITVSDALRCLNISVARPVARNCPACSGQTTAPGKSGDRLWVHTGSVRLPQGRTSGPQAYETFELNEGRLEEILDAAPIEFTMIEESAEVVMALPMPDGMYTWVRIEESPILSAELRDEYPGVRTYRGQGIDDQTATVRFDYTPAGFHAMLISRKGTVFVDPANVDGQTYYLSYWKRDVVGQRFACSLDGDSVIDLDLPRAFATTNPSGDQLRTYRLAVSATGEYTQSFGGTANATAQITTTVNRVTGIYEREVAISLMLTAINIYTDPATDPFTGDDVSVMLGENQTDLDANVGDANYDIGHIFSQGGGGGVALGGVVCSTGSKAQGATSLGNPSGDVFDVDFVAHEIGHQFDADHTWNGTSGSCTGAGQFQANSAYEPGSGSTIMAYAGICAPQNVQANSDDYFHTRSFDQITAFRDGTGACGTATATGNTPPTVEAGPNCTIPTGTPFTLTATSADADGDPRTHAWEQFDLGTQDGAPISTSTTGPLFRSRPPTTSPSRTFPRFADILSGVPTPFEVLPSVNRALNFRVTARDNRANGGGVDYDSLVVTVSGTPFDISTPSSGDRIECGDTGAVTWTVGGGSVASDVEILFSSDGGASFSSVVASTPNDGSHVVTVPTDLTTTGRIMLEPSSECFFAVSDEFSVVDTTPPAVTCVGDITVECRQTGGEPATNPAIAAFLAAPTAADICDPSVAISDNAPSFFPLGTTTVTFSATDDSGNSTACQADVTVVDTVPPDLGIQVEVVPEFRGKFGVDDALFRFLSIEVADICDPAPTVSTVTVNGHVVTPGDLLRLKLRHRNKVKDDGEFALRLEAPEFIFAFTAVDASGNAAAFSAAVQIEDFAGAELDEEEVVPGTRRERGVPIDADAAEEFADHVQDLLEDGYVDPAGLPSAVTGR